MASKGVGDSLDDLPEPDYDHLDFACRQDDGDNDNQSDENGYPKKPHAKKQSQHDGSQSQATPSEPPYILGTLIVRVVAARDLPPDTNNRQHHHQGIGDFLFGQKGGKGSGSANPYASVKFGTSTQRTSQLYDTLDPVWPRGETMFMDVSLPLSKTSHPDPNSVEEETMEVKEDSSASGNDNHRKTDKNGPLDTQYTNNNTEAEAPPSRPHNKNHLDSTESLDIPQPILTIGIFSARDMGKMNKNSKKGEDPRYNPSKNNHHGDSDDSFLGMTSMDLTTLLTGKRPMVDAWVPLTGGTGSVRIVCEYETTDVAPTKGDLVKFTRFCHPADLYPVAPGRIYPVQDVIDPDHVVLSYTSPEGWLCSFVVHRYMVLCVERHCGAAEACRDEWQSITEKLAYSPLVGTVADTVGRLPEEGIFGVGSTVIQGGAGLLGRWLEGGVDTVVKDVSFATNWEGQFNPGSRQQRTSSGSSISDEEGANGDDQNTTTADSSGNIPSQSESQTQSQPAATRKKPPPPTSLSLPDSSTSTKDALPNMPSCPITSEPMIDPVVAADGHTYERVAIARWLQTSDKSPLTGSVLPHKELVPNYGLLSSLQEQEDARKLKAPPPPVTANIAVATVPDPDEMPIPAPLPAPVKGTGTVKEAPGRLEETINIPIYDADVIENDGDRLISETLDSTDTQNERTNEDATDNSSKDGDDANPKK